MIKAVGISVLFKMEALLLFLFSQITEKQNHKFT